MFFPESKGHGIYILQYHDMSFTFRSPYGERKKMKSRLSFNYFVVKIVLIVFYSATTLYQVSDPCFSDTTL